jgi:hypothetical protein
VPFLFHRHHLHIQIFLLCHGIGYISHYLHTHWVSDLCILRFINKLWLPYN